MTRFLAPVLAMVTVMTGPALAQNLEAEEVNRLEGFEVPESVSVHDSGAAYVSNIAGKPWGDDNNGYLSKLAGPAQIAKKRWRTQTEAGVLDAPKGIIFHNNSLWVTDNQRVVQYALNGKAAGTVYPIDGSEQLNDITSNGEAVYVSDSSANKIYKLTEAGVQGQVPAPRGINGVTFAGDQLLGVSFTSGEVYQLDAQGKESPDPMGLAGRFTALDGIEALSDGTLIVSDFKGGRVAAIAPDRESVHTLAELQTPADIGIDRNKNLLYVPSFNGDFVQTYKLKR